MLNAILRGKKRGTGLEGIQLSEGFGGAEDTLTSTVFERLLYLPDETLISILFSPKIWSCSTTKLPQEVTDYEFWPRWVPANSKLTSEIGPTASKAQDDLPSLTKDQQSIQPDLVIRFNDRILIIEAKRSDYWSGQCRVQLARQYARSSIIFPSTPAWVLAVGGLPDGRPDTKNVLRNGVLAELNKLDSRLLIRDFNFAALAWHELMTATVDVIGDVRAHRRLLNDVRAGMSLHGIHTEPPQWLSDLISNDWRSKVGGIKILPSAFLPGLAQTLLPTGISSSSIKTLTYQEAK